jgi:multidrug transporter EmrE-like cation transporter
MNLFAYTSVMVGVLFVGVLLCIEVGRRIGKRRQQQGQDPDKAGTGAVDAAVFGLLGLLIAFTFSGAASRFDARRMQSVNEANAIGTAYLRVDLLPPEHQPEIRDLFRAYTDARLETYRAIPNMERVREQLTIAGKLQEKLWAKGVAACEKGASPAVTSLMIAALNEVFDVATLRTAAADLHVPTIVMAMLFVIAMGCALLAGFDMSAAKGRSIMHYLGFALLIAFAVFVILDMEYPRLGLIRLDGFDRYMEGARAAMK